MSGAGSIRSTSFPAAQFAESTYSAARDSEFSLDKCKAHTIRKAGYKSSSNGQIVRMGWKARLRIGVDGNGAQDRYHRAAFEGSQRVSASLLAQEYRGVSKNDLSDNAAVKSRVYRQDNIRFNPEFNTPEYGMSPRDGWAIRFSRWAHTCNGLTELGAAPTGLLLKLSKVCFSPNRDDKAMGSQIRASFCLPFITAAVGFFAMGVFKEGGGSILQKIGTPYVNEFRGLFFSFSGVAAVAAMFSVAFSACSSLVGSHSALSTKMLDLIQANKDKHIHRLYTLINDAKNNPHAVDLISAALNKKIPLKYRDNSGKPYLLSRLLEDVSRNQGQEGDAKQAMKETIGSYLTDVNWKSSEQNPQSLDLNTHKAELLARENHFVAFTNLIEHVAIHKDGSEKFRDVRLDVEHQVGKLRSSILTKSGNLMDSLGFSKTAEDLKFKGSEKFLTARDNDKSNPAKAAEMRYCADKILSNLHQYGPVTQALARASEAVRGGFNYSIMLSLNYQVTRPVAFLAGRIAEFVFKQPNSRVVSFSIGRVVSSSLWAVVESFVLLSLAAGNGLGFSGAGSSATQSVTFPLKVPLGGVTLLVSVISTGLHMLVVHGVSAPLMAAAQVACYLEGWKGNIAKPMYSEGSWRDPKYW